MYPNLYFAFKDIFGIELEFLKMFQTFGFFVALAFLLAGYFFSLELKRKEADGLISSSPLQVLKGKKPTTIDYIGSLLLGFLVGYKLFYIILHFSVFLEDTQGFILSLKGSFIGGFIVAIVFWFLKYHEARKLDDTEPTLEDSVIHPYEHIGNMVTIAAIAGIIGAKIFHNLENWDEFIVDPIGSLISFSGLTMYGGLICGGGGVIFYAYKNNIAVKPLIDASAPSIMLGYGVGRIGCHLSGDGDWGIDNLAPKPSWLNFLPDWVWSYSYPHNVNGVGVLIPGCEGKYCAMLENPVFPTALYELIICISLFFVLWGMRKRVKIPGIFFSIYLLLNGFERFFIEKIRINTQYHVFGFGITQAEIISSLLIIFGVVGIWWFKKHSSLVSGAPTENKTNF